MRTHLLSLLFVAGVVVGCGDGNMPTAWPAGLPVYQSATASTVSFLGTETATLFNPCTGENVDFEFRFHFKLHETTDANGVVHVAIEINDAGSTGVGEVSGARYRQTGATVIVANPGSSASTFTFVDNFRRPSQGGLGNLLITFVLHLTEKANGDPTADVLVDRVQCVG